MTLRATHLDQEGGPVAYPSMRLQALAVSAVIVGALVLANVAAAYPAWRAAHLRTAVALRAE